MKAAIGCLIGLVFGVCASAEPMLEGRVRLASGEVIASAQVQVFDMTDLQRGAVAQATTDGWGYFALSLAGLPGLALPARFELGANYPNPFNPSTRIPYQLVASSQVRLEVFNLLGQRVATLVAGEQAAGVHTAVWDATDGSGQAVGAGVYLYRLTVGGDSQTGRMVLVDGQAGVSAVGGDGVWSAGVAQDRVYSLVVSGSGIAPYVVADFGIQAGMAPVELVVAAHPAGKVLGDDDSLSGLFDLFGTSAAEEDDAVEEAQTDSTASQGGPDLVVPSASASPLTLTAGQAFTLHVTVQNQGDEPSAATVLRYYRSNNATITSGDTEAGTDAVGALNASATSTESIGLTAPTSAGTYYYGACVESVSGESKTDNNCSHAVTVTVSGSSGTSGGGQASPLDVIVADRFGRAVNGTGITLVDWEGYIANPAMKYTVKAPSGVTTTRVILSSSEQRLYFNIPSKAGANGPEKVLDLGDASSAEFYISIFPDRDGLDETHSLTIEYRDTKSRRHTQSIDIHVIDQDVPSRAFDFDITLDFSQDQTVLFDDSIAKETVQQAANDWAHFIDDMDLDQVSIGQEESWIWDTRGYSHGGKSIRNKMNYTGFLLYAYGVHVVSGGQPSLWSYQSANGVRLPLRRSGNISIDTRGNYNTLGWMTLLPDGEWWKATNFGDVQNDLYSIVLHEIGHALVFNPIYDEFDKFKKIGYVRDPTVKNYYDSYPVIDKFDHLPDTIDPASRRGAFGNEYGGEILFGEQMPLGRWIITKGHLLIAQAIGYTLRETSPFISLSITAALLPEGTLGTSYSYTATVSGGTPAYHWAIESGTLPEGLSIDSFTGTLSGTPSQHGTFNFTLSVSDYDETTPSITRAVTLRIRE